MRGLVPDAPLAPTPVYPIKHFAVLLSPIGRLADDVPTWGWVLAFISGAWQYARSETFTTLLPILLLAALADYWLGVKVARHELRYDPRIAHGGVIGKIAGVTLVLLVRLVEGWLSLAQVAETRGALATTISLALVTVDLQSITHHREALGSAPIPIISHVLAYLRGFTTPKLPPDGK